MKTSYQNNLPKEMLAYFKRNKAWSEVKAPNGAIYREANPLPTFEGFASSIDLNTEILHSWAIEKNEAGGLKYPAFANAYKRSNSI